MGKAPLATHKQTPIMPIVHGYTNCIQIKKCILLFGSIALAKSKAIVLAYHDDTHCYKHLSGLGDPYYANYTICIVANYRHVTSTCLSR